MVVTGTHLRGVDAVGSQRIVLDHAYFDKTGYATIEDVLRTVPQLSSGPNQFGSNDGMRGLYRNPGLGVGVNLRGFGADATLVLVNGRRQANGGTAGNFVDISSIPLSAVDRIEILTDGASALYGSDAVGGVVNIILRKDYQGFESKLRFTTLDGDANQYQIAQTAGFSWTSGALFVGIEHNEQNPLRAVDRSFSKDSDQRENGGSNFSSLSAEPGNILCSAFDGSCVFFEPLYAIPHNLGGRAPSLSDLIPVGPAPDFDGANFQNINEGIELIPAERKSSAYLQASQRMGETVDLEASFRYNRRPIDFERAYLGDFMQVSSANPYYVDIFGDSSNLYVQTGWGAGFSVRTRGITETKNADAAISVKLRRDWRASLQTSYSKQTLDYRAESINPVWMQQAVGSSPPTTGGYDPGQRGYINPFAGGSQENIGILRQLLGHQVYQSRFTTTDTTLQVDGSAASLPAGDLRLAFGVNLRKETGSSSNSVPAGTPLAAEGLDQEVHAAYAEMYFPFFSQSNARPGLQTLAISLAARYENYVDFKDSFNPRIGLNWNPISSVRFRGMWGTSFRAPSPADRERTYFNRSNVSFQNAALDPTSPTGRARAMVVGSGVYPGLHEEKATSRSYGFDWSPKGNLDSRISLTYYDTRFRDKIGRGGIPGQPLALLQQEDVWRDIIIRNPSPELVDELCAATPNPTNCLTQAGVRPIDVIFDYRTRNLALHRIRGVDLQVHQAIDTSVGEIAIAANITRTLESSTQLSRNTPDVNFIDVPGAPLSWRARLDTSWTRDEFSASASVNYTPGYTDPFAGYLDNETRPVSSWVTFDFTFGYRSAYGRRPLDGLFMGFSVVNATNKNPPFVDTGLGYDTANASPYGRMVGLQISKEW